MSFGAEKVTVGQLVEALKTLPQGAEIQLYYDGRPRLVPNGAYRDEDGLIVLGEDRDIYDPDPVPWLFLIAESIIYGAANKQESK